MLYLLKIIFVQSKTSLSLCIFLGGGGEHGGKGGEVKFQQHVLHFFFFLNIHNLTAEKVFVMFHRNFCIVQLKAFHQL